MSLNEELDEEMFEAFGQDINNNLYEEVSQLDEIRDNLDDNLSGTNVEIKMISES